MGSSLGIIADDLSGANDTGLQFAKRGLGTVVLLEAAEAAAPPAAVVVLDTDSRQSTPRVAAERVQAAVRALRALGVAGVYKKIDSTLRGNLGAELDALLDAMPGAGALVAPAFPPNGRTVVDGKLLVRGVPLEATEFAKDPLWPARDSRVASAIARQSRRRIGEIPLSIVRRGGAAVLAEAERLRTEEVDVCVVDAETGADLAAIAKALARANGRWLAVGSAGLAEELPAALGLGPASPLGAGEPKDRRGRPSGVASGPRGALVVVGSLNPVSRRQLGVLAEGTNGYGCGCAGVELRIGPILAGGAAASGEVARAAAALGDALRAGRDASLCLQADAALALDGSGGALDPNELAVRLAAGLGEVVTRLLRDGGPVAGLVMTGGDTAKAICRALGAHAVLVEREVLPGIPQGRLLGGRADGLPVVTKAGGFGGGAALAEAARFLRDLSGLA